MEEFEARLREFKPRRPAALPERARGSRAWWVGPAVAAGLAAAVALAVRDQPIRSELVRSDATQDSGPATPARNAVPTVGSLTALALSDPAALDAALARISRESLPDVGKPGSAFEQLVQEP
jgi:hypothetical protein